MYKENDYLVSKKNVCKVREVKEDENGNYHYLLIPVTDESLKIDVLADNSYLRDIISREELDKLIKRIPEIEIITNIEDKYIEKTYKDLLHSGTYEDLIKIIKTTYIRNNNRIKNNKKVSDKDKTFFEKAEEYLYSEFAITLGLSIDETREYIIKIVQELVG